MCVEEPMLRNGRQVVQENRAEMENDCPEREWLTYRFAIMVWSRNRYGRVSPLGVGMIGGVRFVPLVMVIGMSVVRTGGGMVQ